MNWHGYAFLCGFMLVASAADAACQIPALEPGLSVIAAQRVGRADVKITRQRGAGQRVRIDYENDSFSAALDSNGQVQISFALLSRSNNFTVYLKESIPIRCSLDVPEFEKLFRVILTWTDPVRLNLHVIEPGRSMGGFGHVNLHRPNAQRGDADGQMDVSIPPLDDGSTGELSYVIAEPDDRVRTRLFSFRLEYTSRGVTPLPPFCDQHPLADIQTQLIVLDRGQVQRRSYGTGRAACNEALTEARRLMPLR